jgi:hypothetical protein
MMEGPLFPVEAGWSPLGLSASHVQIQENGFCLNFVYGGMLHDLFKTGR